MRGEGVGRGRGRTQQGSTPSKFISKNNETGLETQFGGTEITARNRMPIIDLPSFLAHIFGCCLVLCVQEVVTHFKL